MQTPQAYGGGSVITTELIQKYLDENKQLILAILDNQNLGKLHECAAYQARLQQNLMYLAAIADAQPDGPVPASQNMAPLWSQHGSNHYGFQQQQQQAIQAALGHSNPPLQHAYQSNPFQMHSSLLRPHQIAETDMYFSSIPNSSSTFLDLNPGGAVQTSIGGELQEIVNGSCEKGSASSNGNPNDGDSKGGSGEIGGESGSGRGDEAGSKVP